MTGFVGFIALLVVALVAGIDEGYRWLRNRLRAGAFRR
jgi:hypothetical protein